MGPTDCRALPPSHTPVVTATAALVLWFPPSTSTFSMPLGLSFPNFYLDKYL